MACRELEHRRPQLSFRVLRCHPVPFACHSDSAKLEKILAMPKRKMWEVTLRLKVVLASSGLRAGGCHPVMRLFRRGGPKF